MHSGIYGYTHEDTSSMDDNPIVYGLAFCLLSIIILLLLIFIISISSCPLSVEYVQYMHTAPEHILCVVVVNFSLCVHTFLLELYDIL